MATQAKHATLEAAVRQIIEAWTEAVRRKDIEAVMAHHAADTVGFDAWGPLAIDAATQRDHWEQCFAGHEGPIAFDHSDLAILADEDVAFAHFLMEMSGTLTGGKRHTFRGRGTLGFRNIDGRWLIVHVHASAPFDPHTGQVTAECP